MTKISVEKVGNRIHLKPLSFLGPDKFQQYLALCKKVPGIRYAKTARCMTGPLDIEVCRELRVVFGSSLVLGPEITAWAEQAVNMEKVLQAALDIDLSQPARLPVVAALAPAMYEAMCNRGYQTADVAFARLAGSHLNANQPGLGKTLETFGALLEREVTGNVLVIGPQTSLGATWAHEIPKWLDEVGAEFVVAGDPTLTTAKREALLRTALADRRTRLKFILINAEMVRMGESLECPTGECDGGDEYCPDRVKHISHKSANFPSLFDVEWNAMVADETHKYLINANERSKKVSQQGLGFQRLRLADGGIKIGLSGTPMKGKPRLLWPTLHWLRPDLYTSQARWSKHYFRTEEDAYAYDGMRVTDDLRLDREEAFNRELSRIMIRRTKAELHRINPAWAPPDKRYAEVWLPLTPKQERAYRQMEKHASATLSGGRLEANGVLAEFTRLRQFAGAYGTMEDGSFVPAMPSNKFDWLIGTFLPRLGITGDAKTEQGESKVVVASQFTQFINLWAKELRARGIDCHVLTGETAIKDRTAMQQDWQTAGGPRVMLLNTNAGGVSITLDYADDLVIMDETWVPDDQEQVEDRVHRTSRTDHQVSIWYVRSEGTIERDMAGDNVMKDDRQKRVLDMRRGIQVAREKFNWKEAALWARPLQ